MTITGTFTDFHNHLMIGVDDGAQLPSDAAAALDQFRAEGARQLITTPHFTGSLTLDAARLEERFAELDAGWAALQAVVMEDATRHGAAMRVERGVEVMLDVPNPDLSDARLRLAGTAFALVEFPSLRFPPLNAEYAVTALRSRGWTAIVAHPERYRNHDEQLTTLVKFRAAGGLLQLNAGSLFGDYGRTAAEHAQAILARGWADYVSSDYHARGEPGVRRFVNALATAGLSEQAELLAVVNPARLLAGEPPLPVPAIETSQTEQARPLWARLVDQAWRPGD